MSEVKWVAGATVLACGGLLGGLNFVGPADASTGTAPVRSENVAVAGASARAAGSVLSGRREVTIVRVQAFESSVSLLNGRLTEVDDDSGRQRFVPTPIGANRYLIKAYDKASNHPASAEPSCWQVHNPRTTAPLTVRGAVCDARNRDQQFTITAQGQKTYAISNQSAFLQYSPSSGLILEELGDAPLDSTFRFVDRGPARQPAGG